MAASFNHENAWAPPAIQMPPPPVTKFKTGLCQLCVTPDKERNIAHARKAIEDAAAKGAKLVLLPEIWNSPYSNDSFPIYAEDIDAGSEASPSTAMLSESSRLLKITIVGGSIPERSGNQLHNTCCAFGSDGKLKAKHRKMKLSHVESLCMEMHKCSYSTAVAMETMKMKSYRLDLIVILSSEVGNSAVGNPSDIHGNESVRSNSATDFMDVDSTYLGVPITGHAHIQDDGDEFSDGDNGGDHLGGVAIYLDRMFLGRMRIGNDVGSREQLELATREFGDLDDGRYIFYYKGMDGYIRISDYESFNQFKNQLYEIDIISVGLGEIVNFL